MTKIEFDKVTEWVRLEARVQACKGHVNPAGAYLAKLRAERDAALELARDLLTT